MIHDLSNGGRTNFITTSDKRDFKKITAYSYRIAWGWERAQQAESEWHPPVNVRADRLFDRAVEQEEKKRMGGKRKRNRLQKRRPVVVDRPF